MNPATEQKILDNIAAARRVLEAAEADLRRIRDAKRLPVLPAPELGDRFSMVVRFPGQSKTYEFLLIRVNGFWYTTGTTNETKRFNSWEALVKWVRKETIGEVLLVPLSQNTSKTTIRLSK